MAVDALQETIRRMKNPTVLDLTLSPGDLPPQLLEEERTPAAAYGRFCRELLAELRDTVPAVRLSFTAFALTGGLDQLAKTVKNAKKLGYYVLLDGPALLSPAMAELAAQAVFGPEAAFPCEGLMVGSYLGSDIWKPFLPFVQMEKKDLFVLVRSANRSAPEIQDLLTGSRHVHMATADMASRHGADTAGKYGYARVCLVAAANAPASLKALRMKYPNRFLLIEGLDYPNANAKNCAAAFDRLGHGAAVLCGTTITRAWAEAGTGGSDYLAQAKAAALRVRKNLTRYVNIL